MRVSGRRAGDSSALEQVHFNLRLGKAALSMNPASAPVFHDAQRLQPFPLLPPTHLQRPPLSWNPSTTGRWRRPTSRTWA